MTGAARSREQPIGRWPMVLPSINSSTSQENQQIYMATKVWFITGATRGIGAEIAKAALVDGNQVVASGSKPAGACQVSKENPQ